MASSSSPAVAAAPSWPAYYYDDDGAGSPPPLASTRYALDGGLDTPGAAMEAQLDPFYNRDSYGGNSYADDAEAWERRPRGTAPRAPDPQPPVRVFTAAWEAQQQQMLGGERNGHARLVRSSAAAAPTAAGSGWGAAVLGALGGAVAGVWTFCMQSAGLGEWQTYRSKREGGAGGRMAVDEAAWEDETPAPAPARPRSDWSLERSFDRLPTPTPGEFPQSDDEAELAVRPVEERLEDERPAKRVHTDDGWVVVRGRAASRGAGETTTTSSSAAAAAARANSSAARRRKRSSLHPRVSGVSFAGSPAPPLPAGQLHGRRSTVGARQQHELLQPRASPAPGGRGLKTSPPSVEVKRFAARMKREERAANERFERLTDRLQEMIKQGKEALGSKVEVVEDVDMW
jgi:hypothetical protein